MKSFPRLRHSKHAHRSGSPQRWVKSRQTGAKSATSVLLPGFYERQTYGEDSTALFHRIRLVSLALLFLLGVVPAATPAAPPPTIAVGVPALEARVVALTNLERQKRGLPPLVPDETLRASALAHSEEMIRLGYFAHESPTPGLRTVSDRALRAGCPDLEVGENIAFYQGFTVDTAARRVVDDWMNSPGHRANILRPSYTSIGLGIASGHGKIMISQEFAARHLSLDPLKETTMGRTVYVRLSGRTLQPTEQIAVFDRDSPLQRVRVDREGRFVAVVRLRALSGTHPLTLGALTDRSREASSFEIYSILPVDTDAVAAR
jgi:uncharacterized protein YkwD